MCEADGRPRRLGSFERMFNHIGTMNALKSEVSENFESYEILLRRVMHENVTIRRGCHHFPYDFENFENIIL